jgi:serine/threonine protein kinase/WD40 repeat protein
LSDLSRIEAIFLGALEQNDPDACAAYLDQACQGQTETRRQVERLLQAHPRARRYLELPEADETRSVDLSQGAEGAGTVIGGRYKLLEPIGEGGMGTVWMAQQTEPVKRTVALKLIKAGMDTKAVLSRFEAERQALALMDHPNIAKVLDAGASDEGRPFFVMELVKGVPITKYCDERKLTLRQRLDLFIPVCQAVQHAHQKGVIHRDLKPSNVLVARYDDKPVPKVIDFGVAKAAGQPLTDRTLVTGFGAVVGTPEYMSPEQAQFNQLDVDTRSDIYALGVLLYELLTGSTPVTRNELEKAGLLEVLRMIRETEPPRPSTRLSTAQGLPQIAANRGSEPKTLAGLLRNDLDWVVMKALEKDRNRRYETATGLAADIGRYLSGEAVLAHPPSASYRLRKFARKHRAAIVTAAAFVGLLIVAVGVSTYLAVKARRAETVAEFKRLEAELNAKLADYHKKISWESLEQSVEARIDADFRAKDMEVELSLKEFANDRNAGLLRLARCVRSMPDVLLTTVPRTRTDDDPEANELLELQAALKRTPGGKAKPIEIRFGGMSSARDLSEYPKQLQLRQFATMAVLAAGQAQAPLLAPFNHDGSPVVVSRLSPTGDRLLTLGTDRTVRLWDAFTGRFIATLRRGDERPMNAGLSPDGATAFTDSPDGVVRLWDTKEGTFRAQTEARPDRIKLEGRVDAIDAVFSHEYLTEYTTISNDRVSTASIDGRGRSLAACAPIELWDSATGRFIARLDSPLEGPPDPPTQMGGPSYQFVEGGRWLKASKESSLILLSAEDGRPVARLEHDKTVHRHEAWLSPSGNVLATIGHDPPVSGHESSSTLFLWDTKTWKLRSTTGPWDQAGHVRMISDDVFYMYLYEGWSSVFRAGNATPVADTPSPLEEVQGDRLLLDSGQLLDSREWRRLQPPKGRKYHPELARFAPDGRFVPIQDSSTNWNLILDTATEKSTNVDGAGIYRPGLGWVGGWVGAALDNYIEIVMHRLPPIDRLNIPPDLLELWAQVAVRGELGDDGTFVKWKEATWEKKRQELASKPAPYPDFPFPGRVAQDRLHWLRQEYEETQGADQPKVARKLLERAEDAGDQAEAARWRRVLTPKATPDVPSAAK